MFNKLIDKSAAKSPWLYHINTGSCNGCDIELDICDMSSISKLVERSFKLDLIECRDLEVYRNVE